MWRICSTLSVIPSYLFCVSLGVGQGHGWRWQVVDHDCQVVTYQLHPAFGGMSWPTGSYLPDSYHFLACSIHRILLSLLTPSTSNSHLIYESEHHRRLVKLVPLHNADRSAQRFLPTGAGSNGICVSEVNLRKTSLLTFLRRASAVIFVGLIYLLILPFYIVVSISSLPMYCDFGWLPW